MTEQQKQSQEQSLHESLSALADGEASELELRRLLKASVLDPNIAVRWGRYQVASSVLRGDPQMSAPQGFAERVSAALADEPATSRSSWWQSLSRVAVAASVAGALVLGVQQYPQWAGNSAPAELAITETRASGSNDNAERETLSLPAGYNAPSRPIARTASAQSGYEPNQQERRRVFFVPIQAQSSQVPLEEVRAYLDYLMQEHTHQAVRNNNQGALPYARLSPGEE